MLRLATLALALLLALPALAQEEIDADYRAFDTIYLVDIPDPIVGTIVSEEPGEITIRQRGTNITFTKRDDEIKDIVRRQTPESAYADRAARLRAGGEAALHRRLGEWCLGHSLALEAEEQLRLAAEREGDPQLALDHRLRLLELIWIRLPDADEEAQAVLLEQTLGIVDAATSAGTSSPLLDLAVARVALRLDLPREAIPALERARDGLEALGQGPPPAEDDPPEPDPSQPDAEPSPSPSGPRYGRDGERLDGPRWDDRPRRDPGGEAGREPTDHSAELIPGLARRHHPDFREVYLELGRLYQEEGHLSESEASYRRLLEVWPEHPRASHGLARLLASQGQHEEALQALTTALELDPSHPRLLLARGQLNYLRQQLTEARADLQQAGKQLLDATDSTINRQLRTALGLVEIQAERFDLAAEHLQAADLDPGFGPARLGLGLLAECRGDLAAARQHYDDAIRLLGARAGEADYALAYVLAAEGDLQGAERQLGRAVQGGYDLELALRSMLELAQRRGDGVLAARVVEALYRLSAAPSPAVLSGLGRSLLESGRLEEARRAFTSALEGAPDYVPALRGLAYCAYDADERQEAAELFARILALLPDDAWAVAGQRNLEEALNRRFWADTFEQAEIDTSWAELADYGVKVAVADGRLRMRGQQSNDERGKTMLTRNIRGEKLVRMEASLDVGAAPVRAGLRWAAGKGPTVVLFHDFDGKVRYSYQRSERSGWEDPQVICDWPGAGLHVLSLDLGSVTKPQLVLEVDGQRLAEVKVPGLKAGTQSTVSLYAQGRELGATVDVSVDEVRLYVHRPQPKERGQGF